LTEVGRIKLNNLKLPQIMKGSDEDQRELKDVFINGYIFTLVKGRSDQNGNTEKPNFMGYQNWALQSICRMKRGIPPIKRTKHNGRT
jgi:hypothetical protein